METATQWVQYLNLAAHPEGGFFKEIYRSDIELNISSKYSGQRNLATSIYYMLESGQVSKLHRLKSDEIWYFHYGAALKVHVFHNGTYQCYTLGTSLNHNQVLQLIIPAGVVFGAEVTEPSSFSILGCMVSPGFHFDDFELISGNEMYAYFPDQKSIIQLLT
jgi:Uncharacterized conserved protein